MGGHHQRVSQYDALRTRLLPLPGAVRTAEVRRRRAHWPGGGAGVGASLAGTHLTPLLQQYGIEDPNVAKAIAGLLGATAGGIGGYGLGGLIPGGEDEEEERELARRRGARRPSKLSLAAEAGQSKLADVLSRVINGDSGLEQIIERLKTAKTKYKKGKKKTTSCK